MISKAKRPVIVIGSQAMLGTAKAGPEALSAAVASLGVPTFVAGMARGLLNDPEGKNGEKIREGRAYRCRITDPCKTHLAYRGPKPESWIPIHSGTKGVQLSRMLTS
jgi:hypothetical protein